MLKKIFLVSFLMFSTVLFSQKNDISISPSSMKGWSSIVIKLKQKGNFDFIIKNRENNNTLFSKKITNKKLSVLKYDFSLFSEGEYIFILKNDKKIIFNTTKVKK